MFTVSQVRDALGDNLSGERIGLAHAFEGVTNDSRAAKPGELFVALKTEVRDGHAFVPDAIEHGVAGVVVQDAEVALPDDVWAFVVPDTKHAIGELARHYRNRFDAKAIAVAGNVGKTTTKEVISAVLGSKYRVLKSPANFNDEIGLAMTLFMLEPQHERVVVEVGMFELGEIARLCEIAQPEISVVLNVGPTHLERLGTMEAIAQAKGEAVEALPADGVAVINADDPHVAAMRHRTRARVVTFGIDNGADFRAKDIEGHGVAGAGFTLLHGGKEWRVHTPLPGARLVPNALAAIAVAANDGMTVEEAIDALGEARIAARLQKKTAAGGATILDDSYNASPASMLAALGVLAETPGRRVALLGDMLELGSAEAEGHRTVGEQAARVVETLYTVGPLGTRIAEAARKAGLAAVRHFDSKDEAVEVLRELLGPGDIILIKASHGLRLDAVVAELQR
jgi:UDP-N-acetylmuramoyl-tripeptide--D-alanyl-D-alanine ligase